jgi:hypothetical protein
VPWGALAPWGASRQRPGERQRLGDAIPRICTQGTFNTLCHSRTFFVEKKAKIEYACTDLFCGTATGGTIRNILYIIFITSLNLVVFFTCI